MITYKIRDIEKKEYKDDMIVDQEWNVYWIYKDWYGIKCLIPTDQWRYTIKREISDDVLEDVWENLPWDRNNLEKHEFKEIIKKTLHKVEFYSKNILYS
jgi:hypothetical protein